jgi:hypothetical protein
MSEDESTLHDPLVSQMTNAGYVRFPQFFKGQDLTSEILNQAVNSSRLVSSQLARNVCGSGILTGLILEPTAGPALLRITPGLAVDPLGRLICIPRNHFIGADDLRDFCFGEEVRTLEIILHLKPVRIASTPLSCTSGIEFQFRVEFRNAQTPSASEDTASELKSFRKKVAQQRRDSLLREADGVPIGLVRLHQVEGRVQLAPENSADPASAIVNHSSIASLADLTRQINSQCRTLLLRPKCASIQTIPVGLASNPFTVSVADLNGKPVAGVRLSASSQSGNVQFGTPGECQWSSVVDLISDDHGDVRFEALAEKTGLHSITVAVVEAPPETAVPATLSLVLNSIPLLECDSIVPVSAIVGDTTELKVRVNSSSRDLLIRFGDADKGSPGKQCEDDRRIRKARWTVQNPDLHSVDAHCFHTDGRRLASICVPVIGEWSRLNHVGGNNQNCDAGDQLRDAIRVRVTKPDGRPIPRALVAFSGPFANVEHTVSSGNGRIEGELYLAYSDDDGVVAFRWKPPLVGLNVLTLSHINQRITDGSSEYCMDSRTSANELHVFAVVHQKHSEDSALEHQE